MTDPSLLHRLQAATGPDRELDADITLALLGGEIVWKQALGTMEAYPAHKVPSANHVSGFAHEPVLAVTSSLDAALALVERVLPDWRWSITNLGYLDGVYQHGCGAYLYHPISSGPVTAHGFATTSALAMILALLTALQATSSTPEGE